MIVATMTMLHCKHTWTGTRIECLASFNGKKLMSQSSYEKTAWLSVRRTPACEPSNFGMTRTIMAMSCSATLRYISATVHIAGAKLC